MQQGIELSESKQLERKRNALVKDTQNDEPVAKRTTIETKAKILDVEQEPQDFLVGDSAENMLFSKNKIIPQGALFETHSGRQIYLDPKSLNLFLGDSVLRKKIVKLVSWYVFDSFIILVIVVNGVLVGLQNYSYRLYLDESLKEKADAIHARNFTLAKYEYAFSAIFFLESMLKIIAQGFFSHRNSYLRSNWNKLDFIIVLILILEMSPVDMDNFGVLKVFRLLRLLRPLRSIQKIPRIKTLVVTLLQSVRGLLDVVGFMIFISSVFAILSIHQFSGTQYRRCRMSEEPEIDLLNPLESSWPINFEANTLCRDDSMCQDMLQNTGTDIFICGSLEEHQLPLDIDGVNDQELIMYDIVGFEHYGKAMASIFQAISLEGWIYMTYNYSDSESPTISLIFFGSLVIFCAFFALNLVLAQIMDSFNKEKESNDPIHQELQENLINKFNRQNCTVRETNDIKSGQSNHDSNQDISQYETAKPLTNQQMPEKTLLNIAVATKMSNNKDLNTINESPKIDVQPVANELEESCQKKQDESFTEFQPATEQAQELEQDSLDLIEQELNLENASKADAAKNQCVLPFYKLVTHPLFNFVIFLLIICNMVLLTMDDHYTTKARAEQLDSFNQYLSAIFLVELILKMVGLGPKNYLKDSYNRFDALVVVCSIVEFILQNTMNRDQGSSSDIFVSFKCLRLLRILKLLRNWTALQSLLQKLVKSLKDIGYFSILIVLFVYIVALLGMELFAYHCFFNNQGEILTGEELKTELKQQNNSLHPPRLNFDNIGSATVTVFVLLVGEDWPGIMYNYMNSIQSNLVQLYFIAVITFGNFILLSLFTTILLENFSEIKAEDKQEQDESHEKEEISCGDQPKLYLRQKLFLFKKQFVLQFMQMFATSADALAAKKEYDAQDFCVEKVDMNKVLPKNKDKSKDDQHPQEEGNTTHAQGLTAHQECNQVEFSPETKKEFQTPELTQENIILGENTDRGMLSESQVIKNQDARRQKYLKELHLKRTTTNQPFHLEQYKSNMFKHQIERRLLLSKINGNSLNCLGKQNKTRVKAFILIHKSWFDWLILGFILVSTILLAFENPLKDPNTNSVKILFYIDIVMTTVFLAEMVIKIIALGFLCNGPESYLRVSWNILDFMIVLVSLLSIIFSHLDLSFLKAIRMLRILRPLRLISHNKSLKIAVTSLLNSVPSIVLLQINVFFFLFMVGILGTTLFAGKFYSCHIDHIPLYQGEGNFSLYNVQAVIKTKTECLDMGGEWVNKDSNYDTLSNSMLSLLALQSTEGWIDVMWASVDSNQPNYSPIPNNKPGIILLYVLLVLILCMLFMDLFVGIVINTFNNEKETLMKNSLLQDHERRWINTQLECYKSKPKILIKVEPKFKYITNLLIRLVTHKCFDIFITTCIIINTIILALQHYGMNQDLKNAFQIINYIFMAIFTFEAIFKLIAMGKLYFRDTWNVFDFVVVVLSLVVLAISFIPNLGLDLSTQMTIGRVLRILRVIRLIKRAKNLQILVETIAESVSAIASLGALLLMFTFLFSILGNSIFSFVQLEGQTTLDHHANFQSFYSSFLLLLRCATGEGWNNLMFDSGRQNSILFQCDPEASYESIQLNGGIPNGCGSSFSNVYFIVFQIIVSQIFLNLFIAIVVDTYIIRKEANSRVVKDLDIEVFIETWKHFDCYATGMINVEDLDPFILMLSQNQSDFFPYNEKLIQDDQIRKYFISFLQVPLHNGYKSYHYYDVLYLMAKTATEIKNFMKILDQPHAIDNLRTNIKVDYRWRFGIALLPEQVEKKVVEHISEKINELFKASKCNIQEQKNQQILVVAELRELYNEKGLKSNKSIDKWTDKDGKERIYTSEHIFALRLIQLKFKKEIRIKKEKTRKFTSDFSENQGSLKEAQDQLTHPEPVSSQPVQDQTFTKDI